MTPDSMKPLPTGKINSINYGGNVGVLIFYSSDMKKVSVAKLTDTV